jgi:hypothetical protein
MKSYIEYLEEGINTTAHLFDMDETLIAHNPKHLKIHVRDNNNNVVRSLTNQEFNKHKLNPGESYDFKDFKSSKILGRSGHPIHSMINRLNDLKRRGFRTGIVTARSDLDDKYAVRKHLNKYGVNIDTTHLYRAGNVEGSSTGDRKRRVISGLIKKHNLKEVHLYDDDIGNHQHFAKLKEEHPGVRLISHVVKHNENTGKTTVQTIRH